MSSQRQLFLNNMAQTTDAPLMLEIEKAEGHYLTDVDGKTYLDLISGISVSNVGHGHPKVKQAIHDQVEKYMHLMVYGEFVQAPQVKYASMLVKALPAHLNNVYFVNSGSEAVEGALKISKRYTNRAEIVSFKGGYHGSTMGALSILGDEYFKRNYRPLVPGNRMLDYNDMTQLEQITCRTAAVIIETIQAESGIAVPDQKYMKALRSRCSEVGALLIFDEIQAGMGRTGKLFAFEHFGVHPDIVLLAKALGGGMPLGAFISSKEIMSVISDNPILGHITTFGGHPVSCAAGAAALDVMMSGDLIDQVESKSSLFEELLKHDSIRAVRRKGFLIAVEFDHFEFNKKVIDACIERGVITDWFLFNSNCLRISPPLTISEDEVQKACSVIIDSINSVK